jgi:acyl-CoA reductase-like NAD-dependent aldehyde dehydrogenase
MMCLLPSLRILSRCVCVYEYVDLWVPLAYILRQNYKLGDPTQPDTNLGPVVSLASAERIRKQVSDAGEYLSQWRSLIS